jgi:hypothetical protein
VRLTGRYKFVPLLGANKKLTLHVEVHDDSFGYRWRQAYMSDLAALEPEVADGWRFREERDGDLGYDGKRFR